MANFYMKLTLVWMPRRVGDLYQNDFGSQRLMDAFVAYLCAFGCGGLNNSPHLVVREGFDCTG